MKIKFKLQSLTEKLPFGKDSQTRTIPSSTNPAYLLIGFNSCFTQTQLLRVECPPNPNTIHTIEGQIKDVPEIVNASMLCSLFLPFSGPVVTYSCVAKNVVAYLDEFGEGEARVDLKNKIGETLYQIKITIVEINGMPKLKSNIKSDREYVMERVKEETARIKEYCKHNNPFQKYGKGTRRVDTFYSHDFFFGRPINCHLMIDTHETNELYWKELFQVVGLMRLTEAGMKEGEWEQLYDTYSVEEQATVLVEMICLTSVNVQYINDYILKKDGTLDHKSTKSDNYGSVNEGSGDCDDMAANIKYTFDTLQKASPFQDKRLDLIRRLSFYYIWFGTLCALNLTPGTEKETVGGHYSGLLILKKWVFDHLKRVDEFSSELKTLYELEQKSGNLVEFIISSDKKEHLPYVLVTEGTCRLYPEQVNVHKQERMEEKPRFKLENFKTANRKAYQTPEVKFILRYNLLVTNYFIDTGVNIPALYLTYNKDGSQIKGVKGTRLLQENLRRGGSKLELIPQFKYFHFDEMIQYCRIVCKDKFMYSPLYRMEDGTHKNRVKFTNGLILSPNIKTPQLYTTNIPKSFKSLNYMLIPPCEILKLRKEDGIVGVYYFSLLPNINFYLVWLNG